MNMTSKQRELYGEHDDEKYFDSVRTLMDSKSRKKFAERSAICEASINWSQVGEPGTIV